MDYGGRKGENGVRRLDWCLKTDTFEKLKDDAGGRRMRRVPFPGAGPRHSLGRSRGLGSFTTFRLHGVSLIQV